MTESKSNDLLEQLSHLSDQQEIILNHLRQSPSKQDEGLTNAVAKEIIDKSKAVSIDDLSTEVAKYAKDKVIKEVGVIPQVIQIKSDKKVSQVKGLFHHKFKTLLNIVVNKIPLMLVGPAGAGKNVTIKQIADALKLDFYFTNAVTEEYKLTGFIDANGKYHETQFYKAFKNGGLFFLDEVDASIPDALIILNAAIANGYFDFPTGRVNAHKDFRVVSAANTYGLGSNPQYVGRNHLDAATLDRFVTVYFDYDSEIEKALCSDKDLYAFISACRVVVEKTQLRYVISMRAIVNGSKLANILTPQQVIKDIVFKGASIDDLSLVNEKIKDYASQGNKYVKALNEIIHPSTSMGNSNSSASIDNAPDIVKSSDTDDDYTLTNF